MHGLRFFILKSMSWASARKSHLLLKIAASIVSLVTGVLANVLDLAGSRFGSIFHVTGTPFDSVLGVASSILDFVSNTLFAQMDHMRLIWVNKG
jgi:hypothetical protein